MKKLFCLFLIFYTSESLCQVNGYAKVTSISGTTLNLSNVNETYDAFVAGEKAIVMQMQDDVIGSTTDDSSFGDIGSIGSAGLYEVVTIASVNIPTSLTISGSLLNSYNTGSNSSVQIITYPTLNSGGGDYTTTSDINAVAWNGNVGGVIAFKVNGTLTLLHNINADGAGFNGGALNDGTSIDCSQTPYRTNSGDNSADKGEGIYRPDLTANPEYAAARGKILTGGGGGNSHNSGGAGGGNYSAGGDGGPGWDALGSCLDDGGSAGGLGGLALSSYISPSRVFMGGGGGAGEGNNGVSTGGGNGGGVILIAANALETTASCSGVSISASGESVGASGGDGAGGGGAGGSIVLEIPNYSVNTSCQLTVDGNGGDGGNVNNAGTHGGGGGGGMGVVIYSIPTPTTNITTSTDPGTGGDNDNDGGGGSAPSGGGTPGAGGGIVDNSNTPLPVELIDLKGRSEGDEVILNWTTSSELNNDYFEIEMSRDGEKFVVVGKIDGFGTTKEVQNYQFSHYNPFNGLSYYRLKQADYDGAYQYSKIISVEHRVSPEPVRVYVYSNPVTDKVIRLKINTDLEEDVLISINNTNSFLVRSVEIDSHNLSDEIRIDGYNLPPGIYFLNVFQGKYHETKKIIVK